MISEETLKQWEELHHEAKTIKATASLIYITPQEFKFLSHLMSIGIVPALIAEVRRLRELVCEKHELYCKECIEEMHAEARSKLGWS